MNLRAALGILALLPAGLGVAPAAHAMEVPLCSGDGRTRTIALVPGGGGGGEIPGKEQPGCCAKACHTGCRKKGVTRQIDTGQ